MATRWDKTLKKNVYVKTKTKKEILELRKQQGLKSGQIRKERAGIPEIKEGLINRFRWDTEVKRMLPIGEFTERFYIDGELKEYNYYF